MNSRVIRTRTPARVIVAAVLIGLFLVGFLVLAIWQSGSAIERARMTGRVVAKEFVPLPEHQVTLGRKGGLAAGESAGEITSLPLKLPTTDGTKKPYNVWVDKKALRRC